MDNLNKEIGERIKQLRLIINEGSKLSSNQFAYLFEETNDKIKNYESGRTSISIPLLVRLYKRGINPIFILTGEGEIFTDTNEGIKLKLIFDNRKVDLNQVFEINIDKKAI